jgi:hypothetical protein
MHSLLKLFIWSGRRWSGRRNRSVRRPPALSVERYGADLLEPRRMMAVVGLPADPAANVSVAADWAASALASATNRFTYTVNDGRASITGYTGTDTALVIPSMINGLAVASIAPQAFYLRGDLTRITLPESITSIGADAFNGCVGLTSFVIPDGVVSIGIQAFSQCRSLTAVTLPSAVTSIGSGAFTGCTGLQSIAISSSAANIAFGEFVFQGCTSLLTFSVGLGNAHYKSVDGLLLTADGRSLLACPTGRNGHLVVPASVSTIGQDAFSGCRGLTAISLPSELTSIGSRAFSDCDGLAGITVPASVSSIGYRAFWGCRSLESFSVEAGNAYFASIDGVLFTADGKLLLRCPSGKTGDFTVPSGVVSIGESAFMYCDRLTSIMLPNELERIEDFAFMFCAVLGSMTLPEGVTFIGQGAFSSCSGLTILELPSRLKSIGGQAFFGCSGLTTIKLPAALYDIDSSAFDYCTALTSIGVETGSAYYASVDGLLLTADGKSLITCPAGKKGGVTIPSGVVSIRSGAFSFSALTSIVVPPGVTSIGSAAFSNSQLTSISLPESVMSIGAFAFTGCDRLVSLVIPSRITAIREFLCSGCSSLTTISIPFGVTSIGRGAFLSCHGLTNITVAASVSSIGDQAFNDCSGLVGLTFLGNAPYLGQEQASFRSVDKATAYYLPGTDGWGSQFGGIHTAPITLPSVPGSLSAVRGNTAATLTWATPASDGHAPISDYVIQYRRATTQAWSTFQHVSSAATTTVVTGLANRQAYVFRVAAVNALGQGSWSTQSSAVIPLPPPSAPGRPVGAAGNGVVSLRFAAPQVTGGLRVTDYVIQYSANSGASWTTAADSVSPLTTATVRGLSNGTPYIFRVAAVTAGGTGAFSVSSAQVIPYLRTALPAAPTSVIGVGSGGTVSLTWAASSANAGGSIRDYVIQYRSAAAGSRWLTYTDGVTSVNAATVRRLVAGRAYVFRVAAKNLAGMGAFSSASAAITA